MIERIPFGSTGHDSTRIIFGAAALGGMSQERADQTLELIASHGINHIDTAASYGDAELRLAPWLQQHRNEVFLATKTGKRTAVEARDELLRSLDRMQVDQVDLIQLHNLTDEAGWQTAMGSGGAVEGLQAAQQEGLTRFIGVTGHGTQVAAMHSRSLQRFPFTSVLVPYNYSMLTQPEYAAELETLLETCRQRQVAVQTIKAIARRRWVDNDQDKRFSWYLPIKEEAAIRRAVHYVLARPGLFLNTTSDATLLPTVFKVAEEPIVAPTDQQMQADAQRLGIEPLFVRGVSDQI